MTSKQKFLCRCRSTEYPPPNLYTAQSSMLQGIFHSNCLIIIFNEKIVKTLQRSNCLSHSQRRSRFIPCPELVKYFLQLIHLKALAILIISQKQMHEVLVASLLVVRLTDVMLRQGRCYDGVDSIENYYIPLHHIIFYSNYEAKERDFLR